MTDKIDVAYNEDELVNPDWMDKDFFEMVLKKSENDSLLKVLFIYKLKVELKFFFQRL